MIESYGDILSTLSQQSNYWQAEAEKYKSMVSQMGSTINDPRSAIQSIKIRTKYTPDINIDQPLAIREPSKGLPIPITEIAAKYLQPEIEMNIKGYGPVKFSPYGSPGPTQWPKIKVGVYIAGGISLFILLSLIRRLLP